jgi:hypothetical protein
VCGLGLRVHQPSRGYAQLACRLIRLKRIYNF